MDAGLVDMIPIEQSIRQGNTKHVFISTKEENYVRKPAPGWQIVKELEEQGNAIVLRPSADYGVTRYTHDKELLGRWFDLGYEDTKNRLDMIREFMEK